MNHNILLFIPSWNKVDDLQLSHFIDVTMIHQTHNIAIKDNVTVTLIILMTGDETHIPYQHKLITEIIIDKQIVLDLLIEYQVTEVPLSIIVNKNYNRKENNINITDDVNNNSNNDGSDNDKDSTSSNNNNNNNNRIVHREFTYGSAELSLKSLDLFAIGIDAYNEFDLHTAAYNFNLSILIDPKYKSALFNLAGIMHMIGFPILAMSYIERVLLLDIEDMVAHSFLWALTQLKEISLIGINTYRRLSQAGDIKASQKLAALTGLGALASKGDPKYAQQIYDDMGDNFEEKLVSHLCYRGPWELYDMIEELLLKENKDNHNNNDDNNNDNSDDEIRNNNEKKDDKSISIYPEKGKWRVLDLGCGSGLCGKIFESFVAPLVLQVTITTRIASSISNNDSNESHENDVNLDDNNAVIDEEDRETHDSLISLAAGREQKGSVMIGVDISIKMVEITLKSGFYSTVVRGDLGQALDALGGNSVDGDASNNSNNSNNNGENTKFDINKSNDSMLNNDDEQKIFNNICTKFDLILVADTFIYIGGLGSIFNKIKKSLNKNGLFAFSIEDLDKSPMKIHRENVGENSGNSSFFDSNCAVSNSALNNTLNSTLNNHLLVDNEPMGACPGWGVQLLTSARFAHTNKYIETLCEIYGFEIMLSRNVILRTEETVPLSGILYILGN